MLAGRPMKSRPVILLLSNSPGYVRPPASAGADESSLTSVQLQGGVRHGGQHLLSL